MADERLAEVQMSSMRVSREQTKATLNLAAFDRSIVAYKWTQRHFLNHEHFQHWKIVQGKKKIFFHGSFIFESKGKFSCVFHEVKRRKFESSMKKRVEMVTIRESLKRKFSLKIPAVSLTLYFGARV